MAIVVGTAAQDHEGPIYVEVDGLPDTPGGTAGLYEGIDTRGGAADRVLTTAREVYGDGLELARRCAAQAAARLGSLDLGGSAQALRPSEIELQLSIRLDAELGAVLVKSTAEAQLVVTFRWQPGGAS
jgi:hypothetical protein